MLSPVQTNKQEYVCLAPKIAEASATENSKGGRPENESITALVIQLNATCSFQAGWPHYLQIVI